MKRKMLCLFLLIMIIMTDMLSVQAGTEDGTNYKTAATTADFCGELSVASSSLGTDDAMDTENQPKFKVYEPVYGYVRQFKGDYVSVYANGVYSLVDSKNNMHYSSNQDGFGNYSENFIATYDADKREITFSNLDGYAFTLVGYKWAGEFLGGKCVVVNSEGRYGLIDTEGSFIIDCLYDEIIYDTSNTVLLCSGSSWSSVTLGQSIHSLSLRSGAPALYDPVLSATGKHIIASNGTAYGILTSDNTQITEFQYELIRDAQNGLFVGYYGDSVDLIALDGTVTATLTAYFVGGYSENKIAVFDGFKFFYVDKTGRTIVNVNIADIISAEDFHEEYAVINVDGKGYTYIDTSGNIVADSYWDYAARFAYGYALVMNYFNDNDGNSLRRWSIIDTDFNIVMTLEDDLYIDFLSEHSTDFSEGYIRTIDRDTGLMGFIRLDGFDFDPNAKPNATTVTGKAISWNHEDNAVIRLYDASMSHDAIKADIKLGTPLLGTAATSKGSITATGDKRYDQIFSFDGVADGSYKLAIWKPRGTADKPYVPVIQEVTVSGAALDLGELTLWLYGDVNYDGMVNTADGMAIYRKAAGKTSAFDLISDPAILLAGDINHDGSINTADGMAIYRCAAGKTSAFDLLS